MSWQMDWNNLSWLVGLIAIATTLNTSLLIAIFWTLSKPAPRSSSLPEALLAQRRGSSN